MTRVRKLLLWLVMIGLAGLALLLTLVWQLALSKEPDQPGAIAEERSIGFFDPHLHVRPLEVAEIGNLPESSPPQRGYRHIWIRLETRSSAAQLQMDPSRLSVTLRNGFVHYEPLAAVDLPTEIDGIPVRRRFEGPLDVEAAIEAWFVFSIPDDLTTAELWVSKDTWVTRLVPEFEATPLHDKAVYALELASHIGPGSDR